MKIFNQKNIDVIKEIMEYVLVILLIFECNSIYSQIYNIHYVIRSLIIIITCGIMVFDILARMINKKLILYMPILLYVFFDLVCSVIMFFKCDNNTGRFIILMYFVMFIPIFFIYLSNMEYIDLKRIVKKFINVVLIISVTSMFFWIFGSVLNIIKPVNEIKVVWGRPYSLMDNYFGLYFDSHQDIYWLTNSPIPRNIGIFGEAPMYAAVLMFAMTANLILYNNEMSQINKKFNVIKSIILILTMLSTISATGIIFSLIIIIFYVIKILKNLSVKIRRIICGIIVIGLIALVPIGFQVFNKKVSSSSAMHRNNDIINGIRVFAENPIIGKGINHSRENESNSEKGYGYSNSIIPIITDGGVLLGMLYLVPMLLLIIKNFFYRRINNIAILIMYTIILFTTIIQYRLFMFVIVGIMYCITFENTIWNCQKNESGCLDE